MHLYVTIAYMFINIHFIVFSVSDNHTHTHTHTHAHTHTYLLPVNHQHLHVPDFSLINSQTCTIWICLFLLTEEDSVDDQSIISRRRTRSLTGSVYHISIYIYYMVVVGRLDQKMPGPIFCPSPALLMRH